MGQIFRPKISAPVEGVGNCTTCQKDEKNKLCKNYKPIKLFIEEGE
jgi:hypothetical protein